MNYKLYYIIGLIILLNTVGSIKITKDEILKRVTERNEKDLQEFGFCGELKDYSNYKHNCTFMFYCISEDNCQPDKNPNSPIFEFSDDDGNIQKYIKNNNSDYKCTVNTDCLSNLCVNSTCVAGGESIFTECSDNFNLVNYFQIMNCGKVNYDKCDDDDECAGDYCYHNLCRSHHEFNPISKSMEAFFILYAILYIFGPIGFIALVICCICCCCVMWNNKKERKLKNAMNATTSATV